MGSVCFVLKRMMETVGAKPLPILCILGAAYILGIFIFNKKKIITAMKEINNLH